MSKSKYISNKNETIRLFKNPVLEYFSHIHPLTPVVTYIPIVALCIYYGLKNITILGALGAFTGGIILWTFVEYVFHRWVFHYHPTSYIGQRLHFLIHGIHHDYPKDATRLVLPPMVSVPLALAFFYLFKLFLGPYYLVFFAGFILGYVCYDSIHYATHHLKMNGRMGKFLRSYHMRHHFEDDHSAYGVSSPLWDYIFNTIPGFMHQRQKIASGMTIKNQMEKA